MPLTDDSSIVETYTDALTTRIMPVSGKDSAAALTTAEQALADGDAAGTTVFITDGVEQNAFDAFKRKTDNGTTGAVPLVTGRLRPGQPPVATQTFAITSSNSIDCSTAPAHRRLRSIGWRSRETGMRGNTRHARRAEIRCPS